MKKNAYIILICMFWFLYGNASNLKYESIEHLYLGKNIYLKYLDSKGNIIKKNGGDAIVKQVSDNTNMIGLSFAELIYLSGDFITDPSTKIFHDADPKDYETIFKQNFNMYDKKFKGDYSGATELAVGSFIPKIQKIINKEQEDNEQNINNHQPIVINIKDNLDLNCATGGGCSEQKDMLNKKGLYAVASVNKGSDHFGGNAIINYLTGHKLALKTALDANKNVDELNKAYAYEGYAQHFLTDLFAAGHMRTPIDELASVQDQSWDKFFDWLLTLGLGIEKRDINLAFAKAMHDEDNAHGLYVRTNNNKTSWQAFGDSHLFINANATNLENTKLAMQTAVNQIFDAYQNEKKFNDQEKEAYLLQKESEIKDYMPDLEFVKNTQANFSPKYAVINNYLFNPGSGSRDWPDGSKGIVCGLVEIIDQITDDQTAKTVSDYVKTNYCNNTIYGFARTNNYLNSNLVYISEKDGLLMSTQREDGKIHVGINYNNPQVINNKQEFYVTPIVTDTDIKCTFKYPIKLMRYGTYTSLDQKDGNYWGYFKVILSKEYVDCKDSSGNISDATVFFQASSTNGNEYFGLNKKANSYNVKLCTDNNGIQYLTNVSNTCEIWH